MPYSTAFLYLGGGVFVTGALVLVVRLMSKKTVENKLVQPVVMSEAIAA
jgi:hypothetical protein